MTNAKNSKIILDMSAGGRMFWYDKKNPNVLFIDIRCRARGFLLERPNFEVAPDEVGDFRKLRFKDKRFKLVVFDPPHIIRNTNNEGSILKKRYGYLTPDNWEYSIRAGFKEGFRVLEKYGVLIFKWNEENVKIGQILDLAPVRPLFGHRVGIKLKTHWLCFMKLT